MVSKTERFGGEQEVHLSAGGGGLSSGGGGESVDVVSCRRLRRAVFTVLASM